QTSRYEHPFFIGGEAGYGSNPSFERNAVTQDAAVKRRRPAGVSAANQSLPSAGTHTLRVENFLLHGEQSHN
ncbi:MAG: hypothetical protein AB2689_24935, partial [Candidatus Thiodiazotropha taylori]